MDLLGETACGANTVLLPRFELYPEPIWIVTDVLSRREYHTNTTVSPSGDRGGRLHDRVGLLLFSYADVNVTYSDPMFTHSCVSSTYPELLSTHVELISRHADISSTDAELSSTHAELISKHADISSRHADLVSTHAHLVSKHADLVSKHPDLAETHADPASTHAGLAETHAELASTPAGLVSAQIRHPLGGVTDATPQLKARWCEGRARALVRLKIKDHRLNPDGMKGTRSMSR